MTSVARFNVRYVKDEAVLRQQELMKLAAQSSFIDARVGIQEFSLFEEVYQNVATEPDLLKVVRRVISFWEQMDDQDRARWGSILINKNKQIWGRFYQEHIANCEQCPQDDQLLWMKLVPTLNVEYGDLIRIGHSLDCLDRDVLQRIEYECKPGSWQRKVLARVSCHDLSSQSIVLKGFLLCFLLGKVSEADMQAIWEHELESVLDMMDKPTVKAMAIHCLEQLAKRCTTEMSSLPTMQWTVYRYRSSNASAFKTYPHTVASVIEMNLLLGNNTCVSKGYIPFDAGEKIFKFTLTDPHNITSQACGTGAGLKEVQPQVVPHPLSCLEWITVARPMDKAPSVMDSWSPVDFATVTNECTSPGLKALYDEAAAMLPARLVHHLLLIFNKEHTLIFLQKIAELKAAGFCLKIVPALHGPSNWTVVDKIMAQGFRHSRSSNNSAEHPNLPPWSNGHFYGKGVYFDRKGDDQGDTPNGCGYGADCVGCFIGMTIHYWKPTDRDVPHYPNCHHSRDPNATVFNAASHWSVVKNPELTLLTGFVHHTRLGQPQEYAPDYLIERFRNSTEERSVQITQNGPESYRDHEYDLQRLPEIPMGICLVPRPSDVNLLPPSMRPADGSIPPQPVLAVGCIGTGVRKSRAMCWEPANLGDELPKDSPAKRSLSDPPAPPAKRTKQVLVVGTVLVVGQQANNTTKKTKADASTMKPNQKDWYQQSFTAFRTWQKRINIQVHTLPPVKPSAFILPSHAPSDLDVTKLIFPWDGADQHLQKKLAIYDLNAPSRSTTSPPPTPSPPISPVTYTPPGSPPLQPAPATSPPASPTLQPVGNRPPTPRPAPADAINVDTDDDSDDVPMQIDDTLQSANDDSESDSDFEPDTD